MTDATSSETSPETSVDAEGGPRGHEVIHGYLRLLDSSPGVYRMLDGQSRVLYVGKARNLKARVSSYARPTGHSRRIARMISETASMMFLTTRTETEALLLEQNLIKQLKPKFNVLLRDDKSFPNIQVTTQHEYPQIRKHRGAKTEKAAYYGPFASAGAVNRTLNQLQKVFLLRNCTDSQFEGRTRPCLLYQIKRCSAPCVGYISEEDYAASVRDAQRFLSGKSTNVQAALAQQMQQASEEMEFEKAAALRDRIRALTQVQTVQGINPQGVAEADIVALHMEHGQACVQVFFIRANQNWGNKDYYPRVGDDVDEAEVLEAFLGQFYDTKDPARLILLSHEIENPDLMSEALSGKIDRKVELAVPKRGEKAELIEGTAPEHDDTRRLPEAAPTIARSLDRWRQIRRARMCDTMIAMGTITGTGRTCLAKTSDREPNEAQYLTPTPAAVRTLAATPGASQAGRLPPPGGDLRGPHLKEVAAPAPATAVKEPA